MGDVDRQILNEENKKLRSIISDVEEELNEDHSHQWEFCSGCALCIIEEGLKDLEHINDAEDEVKDRPNTTDTIQQE